MHAASAAPSLTELPLEMTLAEAPRAPVITSPALRPVAAALLIGLTTALAIFGARAVGPVAAVWAAGGLAFQLWITAARRPWTDPVYAVATTVGFVGGNWLAGNTGSNLLVFPASDVLEVVVAVWLARRFVPQPFGLTSLGRLTRFIGVCLVAPLASAIFAGLFAAFPGKLTFTAAFTTFYLGHAMGFAVVAAFLLSVGAACRFTVRQALEFAAVLTLMTAVVFGTLSYGPRSMGFLIYPALLLATLRFRMLGAASASLIIAAIEFGFVMVWIRSGQIPHASASDAVLHYQLYLIFGCLPTLFIAVVLDERDRFASTAAQRQAEVEAASRARSKLMENVSHEMRTPLNAIVAISDLLTREHMGPLCETQKELMQTLVGSAHKLHSLALNLTEVARVETGDLMVGAEPFDLVALGREVYAANREIMTAFGGQVTVEAPGARLIALADPVLTRQIVTHMMTNAAKYAGRYGPITVKYLRAGAFVRIEIEDQGPGISDEQRREVFEPFNRLNKCTQHAEGVGIGLALSRKLAELQGGRLDFRSGPGKGACFWLELPAA